MIERPYKDVDAKRENAEYDLSKISSPPPYAQIDAAVTAKYGWPWSVEAQKLYAAICDLFDDKCHCGQYTIPTALDGVSWYWQRHGRDACTLELPNEECWCGLLRSEHIDGHKKGVTPPSERAGAEQPQPPSSLIEQIQKLEKPYEQIRSGHDWWTGWNAALERATEIVRASHPSPQRDEQEKK